MNKSAGNSGFVYFQEKNPYGKVQFLYSGAVFYTILIIMQVFIDHG